MITFSVSIASLAVSKRSFFIAHSADRCHEIVDLGRARHLRQQMSRQSLSRVIIPEMYAGNESLALKPCHCGRAFFNCTANS